MSILIKIYPTPNAANPATSFPTINAFVVSGATDDTYPNCPPNTKAPLTANAAFKILPFQFISWYTPIMGRQLANDENKPSIEYSSISYLSVILLRTLFNLRDTIYNIG